MNKKRFEWLVDSCFTAPGLKLEKGQAYDAEAFGLEIVEEWVRSGAAKYAAAGASKAKAADQEG
jgi:hypothetical protein